MNLFVKSLIQSSCHLLNWRSSSVIKIKTFYGPGFLHLSTMAKANLKNNVYAISDLHVDYKENLNWVNSWSDEKYQRDALIVAGDVTDKLVLLEAVLRCLKTKFSEVFFSPGNHELWMRNQEDCKDSIEKFNKLLKMCERIGVYTKPRKFVISESEAVWIVPLFSWYAYPEDDATDTLYITPSGGKENQDNLDNMWMDTHLCQWPELNGMTRSQYFSDLNSDSISRAYDAPVITFSHFVPRQDLIRPTDKELDYVNNERSQKGLDPLPPYKPIPGFNFTRYAGSAMIDTQLRLIGSRLHVYGHQHRNRDRVIDNVRYISHCLGNPREQKACQTWGITDWNGPKLIWPLL